MSASWKAQENNIVGGWCVTNFTEDPATHDFRDGTGEMIDCPSEQMAERIAILLNRGDGLEIECRQRYAIEQRGRSHSGWMMHTVNAGSREEATEKMRFLSAIHTHHQFRLCLVTETKSVVVETG